MLLASVGPRCVTGWDRLPRRAGAFEPCYLPARINELAGATSGHSEPHPEDDRINARSQTATQTEPVPSHPGRRDGAKSAFGASVITGAFLLRSYPRRVAPVGRSQRSTDESGL